MNISFLQILPEPFYAGVYHQLLGKPDLIQHFQSQAGMPHLSGKMGIRVSSREALWISLTGTAPIQIKSW